MNWMDVVTIIILAVSSLYGLATGFILSIVKVGSYILAFIVARLYYATFTRFIIENTSIYNNLYGFIDNRLGEFAISGQHLLGDLTTETLETLSLPKVLSNNIATSVGSITDGISNLSVTNFLSTLIINIISIILIFVVVRIIIMFIGKILDKFASIPILNEFNKLGGFIFGLLKGALIIFTITAIIFPLSSLMPNNYLVETVQATKITRLFYDYNLILYIFKEMVFVSGI